MERENNSLSLEHRLAFRLPIQIKFQYKIINPPDSLNILHNAITKNINVLGLLFECERQLPIDSELKIILFVPGLRPESFELKGRVVRIERLLNSQNFDMGIKFMEITEIQKEEIQKRLERMNILKLLERARRKDISDLHLTSNSPPMVRSYGEIKPLDGEPLSSEEIKQMIYSILSNHQKELFEAEKDLDFSFSPSPDARYRVSIYRQRGNIEVVFRNIMPYIKDKEELGLPDVIDDIWQLKNGIVIIGGTTGSGKTTTIAAVIDIINKKRGGVILSLEKPIEYLHKNIKAIVKQREVGTDVLSFAKGIKAALKQDPDVIVVGEIQDADSMETALEAAETGHLVITSLHSTGTRQVFDRIISFFPLEQRNYICARLSRSIKAIIIQSLLLHKSGVSRVLATEVCFANTAVKRIIYSGDFTQLPSVIQTGSQYKMHLMEDSVEKLFEQGLIDAESYQLYRKTKI